MTKPRLLTVTFVLAALGGIPAIVGFVNRSVSENPIFLGLSAARLVVFAGLVALVLAFAGLAYLSHKNKLPEFPYTQTRFTISLSSLILLLIIFYILSLLPNYRLRTYVDHVDNLRPVFFWGLGTTLLFILTLSIGQFGSHPDLWSAYWKPRRRTWQTGLTVAGLMVAVGCAAVALKILAYVEDFWYGTGVPLLMWQVILAVVAGFSLTKFIRTRRDILPFLLIWGLAAVLWASWPYQESFNMSKPLPPNFEPYPVVDAEYYDLGAQFALIGEGINGGVFTDRPLYMVFLFFLHLVVGQDFITLVNLQAALFAVFPAIIYLIGKHLHSRQAGIVAALFITFRGINSLVASPWINNSHLKNILIDTPTAIAVAAMTLFLVQAIRHKKWTSLLWAAGMNGLAIMLRTHTLIFIPLILLAAGVLLIKQNWRQWLGGGALLALGLSAVLLPWMLWNNVSFVQFFKLRWDAMFKDRYSTVIPSTERLRSTQPTRPENVDLQNTDTEIPFQGVHLLHNLMVTPFSMPVTFSLEDIRHTVKDNPYWDPKWQGNIEAPDALMLVFGLLLVSLGVGAAHQKEWFAGFIPALVLLGYYTANSIARTSGGRYLVPADWVVYLYLGIGCVEAVRAVGAYFGRPVTEEQLEQVQISRPWSKLTVLVLGILLSVGMMVPFAPSRVKPVYASRLTKGELFKQVITTDLNTFTPLTIKELREFRSIPSSVAIRGKVIYPIYFKQGDGLPLHKTLSQRKENYPRFVFKVIGPKLNTYVILPSETSFVLPHTSEVIIIGCKEKHEIQALALIFPEEGIGYMRSPEAPLTCPLKIPVCDNNWNCK